MISIINQKISLIHVILDNKNCKNKMITVQVAIKKFVAHPEGPQIIINTFLIEFLTEPVT